jgi:hypothetical protein
MKKLALIASCLMLIACLVSCVSEPNNYDHDKYLHPTEVNIYHLYLNSSIGHKTFTEYIYEMPGKTIKMYRDCNGVATFYVQNHDSTEKEKTGTQGTYFDY